VTRFSKTRMEHTLRLSLGEVLGLSNIASVTLHDLRQRRAKAPVPNKNASPRPDDAIDDLRAAQSAHAEVAPKPADGAKPPPC
jgi:hypothetical protein